MRKRRIVWTGAVVGAGLVATLMLVANASLRERVREANCARIEKGMTESEVEAIFRRPASGWAEISWTLPQQATAEETKTVVTMGGESAKGLQTGHTSFHPSVAWVADWRGDVLARVLFTKEMRVVGVLHAPTRREPWFRQLAHRIGVRLPF
jgi:hypothetical protein